MLETMWGGGGQCLKPFDISGIHRQLYEPDIMEKGLSILDLYKGIRKNDPRAMAYYYHFEVYI